MNEVLRDAPFYGDGGGMTLTGGEPAMQSAFSEAMVRLAAAEGVSTAMETCGHAQWEALERLLPHLDHILFDLKHVDAETHRAYTGVGTERILANLRRLVNLSAPVTVRVPLIPGFNTSFASLRAIAGFVRGLDGSIESIDLLPYHALGRAKYRALGRAYRWEEHRPLSDAELGALIEVVKQAGLEVNVGGWPGAHRTSTQG
jgi:pyruvate formate lyase activating enzyme